MAYIGAMMTLPGIAGFILTIGIGVDSNVLIFERIKEELAAGKSARAAVAAGFDRVFLTILDTHVASLISAAFLFQFGTGPIRGFATTLFFGLLSNVFTAVFVSRTLFEFVLSRRRERDAEHLSAMRILTNVNINFLRWRWHALALSWLIILAGVGLMACRGLPLGIDFSGGTLVVAAVRASRCLKTPSARRSKASLARRCVQQYGDRGDNEMLVRLPNWSHVEEGTNLEQAARDVVSTHREGQPRQVRGASAPRSSVRSSARICSARASTPRWRRSSAS